jgi:5-methylcytosine-specific restriction endonuclease McrA
MAEIKKNNLNIYNFLRGKLTTKPTTLPKAEVAQLATDQRQVEFLKKFGVVSQDLRKTLEDSSLILYERSQLAQTLDRSLAHPLMVAATEVYADTSTTYSALNNASVWCTTENRDYRYQIEKLFDIINLEELIYDWAWTTCLDGDTKIRLIGGATPTIKEMAENRDKYVGEYVWSVHPKTKKLEPDKIINVFKTKDNAELLRIWVDDGSFVDCTPDHRFMLRDGSFKQAQDLIVGESLMPLYSKRCQNGTSTHIKFYNPENGKWCAGYKLNLTKEFLEENYLKGGLSLCEIGRRVNCEATTVLNRLKKFNMPRRSFCEAVGAYNKILTKEFLVENYINKKVSAVEIGKLVGCNCTIIYDYLRRYNIVVRSNSKAHVGRSGYSPFASILTEEFLVENYINKCYNANQIAKMIGASSGGVVTRRLKKLNIKVRSQSWYRQGNLLTPLNKLIYRLQESNIWRKAVFERDNYTCQECGKRGSKIEAHHVNPFAVLLTEFLQCYSQFSPVEDKETLARLATTWAPFWDVNNGRTLCKGCHENIKGNTDMLVRNYKTNKGYLNHKVLKIERLSNKASVYDITTEKNHNFATAAGVFVHNCTFGDLFVQVYGEPGVGVVSISDDQHPINVSRVDYNGRLVGFYETPLGYASADERKLLSPYDYVHLRLLGIKRRRPLYSDPQYSEYRTISIMTPDVRRLTSKYGNSVLSSALPTWKRLRLAEDSVLMARINRGVLRYIYKIGIPEGMANQEAVSNLIDEYVTELKRARALNTDASSPNYADRFNALSSLEDIIIPVWGEANNVMIDKIGGEVDIRWITDIEELRNQLATALRVPLPLLSGYSKEAPPALGQGSLERLDIRFARQARRIQRALICGLTRLVQIHLAYQGIDPDLNMFKINMTETSSAEEEELKDALDKGVDVVDKLSELVTRMLGEEDVDKRALLDYLNKKFLKLNDMDLEKMVLKGNPHAFKTERTEEPVEGVETADAASLEEPNPFREDRTMSDLKSYLPLNEGKNEEWDKVWSNKKVVVKPIEGKK